MCPALSLFLKVYAETIDRGLANPVPVFSDNYRMVWAELNGDVRQCWWLS